MFKIGGVDELERGRFAVYSTSEIFDTIYIACSVFGPERNRLLSEVELQEQRHEHQKPNRATMADLQLTHRPAVSFARSDDGASSPALALEPHGRGAGRIESRLPGGSHRSLAAIVGDSYICYYSLTSTALVALIAPS